MRRASKVPVGSRYMEKSQRHLHRQQGVCTWMHMDVNAYGCECTWMWMHIGKDLQPIRPQNHHGGCHAYMHKPGLYFNCIGQTLSNKGVEEAKMKPSAPAPT